MPSYVVINMIIPFLAIFVVAFGLGMILVLFSYTRKLGYRFLFGSSYCVAGFMFGFLASLIFYTAVQNGYMVVFLNDLPPFLVRGFQLGSQFGPVLVSAALGFGAFLWGFTRGYRPFYQPPRLAS